MITFTNKPIKELTANEIDQIVVLVAPYYLDASALLEREFQKNKHIYFTCIGGKMVAFFMIGNGTLTINEKPLETIYYGLSCVDKKYRQSRISGTVYMQAVLDISERYNSLPFIGWGTTATPIVVRVLRRYWRLIQPDETNCFETSFYPVAKAIRQKHYQHALHSANPFVLKSVANNTFYSDEERTMLADVRAKHDISILNQLGIDETEGDRLLVLMDLPEADRLSYFRKSLELIEEEFEDQVLQGQDAGLKVNVSQPNQTGV